jgi:hypothetical protein
MRWYGMPAWNFEYHGPWWISGETEDTTIFVAAVVAPSEDDARRVIEASYDDGAAGVFEWSFSNPRSDDWEPFCDRFPRADWMQWPFPTTGIPATTGKE